MRIIVSTTIEVGRVQKHNLTAKFPRRTLFIEAVVSDRRVAFKDLR